MKDWLKIIILLLLVSVALICFLPKMCSEPVRNPEQFKTQLKEKDDRIKELEQNSLYLLSKVDSLATLKQKIKLQTIYREREIDEAIGKDSANALVEYRKAMVENNYLPQGGRELSYYEIGTGAILMSKVPKLELTIHLQDQQIENLEQLDKNNQSIKQGYKDIIQIKDLSIDDLRSQIKELNSFWDDRIICYGGVGMSYNANNELQPTIQIGLGVKLFTIYK